MYLYSLLQHYKNWKPDKEETVFRTKKCAYIYTPFFSITRTGSQTIHTASSASQNMGARQYTQHLQLHKNWELDNTHTSLNTINNITRGWSQTVKTQSIFSNTRTRCQTFGYELSSSSVDLRRYFHCSHFGIRATISITRMLAWLFSLSFFIGFNRLSVV